MKTLLIIISALALLSGCSGGSSDTESTSDSTRVSVANDSGMPVPEKQPEINRSPQSVDSSFPNAEVGKNEIDTAAILTSPKDSIISNGTKIREALFGYSLFKNIRQNATRNINAYVTILNAVSKVIDTLKQINAGYVPERKNDTATVTTKNIFVLKALNNHLVNAGDSDFIIKPFANA